MKISQYPNTGILKSGDILIFARPSGVDSGNYGVYVRDLLKTYNWPEARFSGNFAGNYFGNDRLHISGNTLFLPAHSISDNIPAAIRFVNYSGTPQENGSIRCWHDHDGVANHPELIILSNRGIGLVPAQNCSNDEGFIQIGSSSNFNERIYLQYDTINSSNYGNDGITTWPYGHSKRLGFIAQGNSGGNTFYTSPGILGASANTGAYGSDGTSPNYGPQRGELWFYARLPEYPFTTYPGTRMGKMLYNGWDLRGKQIRENTASSNSSINIDFDGSISQTFDVTSNSVTITGLNLNSSSSNFQESHCLIKSGPYTPSFTFPSWSWGSQTGIASAPTGLLSDQALSLHIKSFDSGNAGIVATYSIHNYPFIYETEAQSFFTAASISNSTQKLAVNNLVKNAKTNNWWNKCDTIYPFVGGTSGSHSYNLRNTGQFRISWSGSVLHNAIGISGNGTDGWGNTNLTLATQATKYTRDSAHLMAYCHTILPTSFGNFVGCADGTSYALLLNNASSLCVGGLNNGDSNGGTISVSSNFSGFLAVSRTTSTVQTIYGKTSSVGGNSTATTSVPNHIVGILARPFAGFSPDELSNAQLKGASIGSGLSSVEMTTMKSDWDTFQSTLGR